MKRLEPKHYKAITLLIAGHTTDEIAKSTGVGKKSIEAWKRHPEFNKIYRQALSQSFDEGMAKLLLGIDKAVEKLIEIIDDPDVGSRTRLTAINVLLTHASKVKDSTIESRVEELEQALESDGTITITAQEVRE